MVRFTRKSHRMFLSYYINARYVSATRWGHTTVMSCGQRHLLSERRSNRDTVQRLNATSDQKEIPNDKIYTSQSFRSEVRTEEEEFNASVHWVPLRTSK